MLDFQSFKKQLAHREATREALKKCPYPDLDRVTYEAYLDLLGSPDPDNPHPPARSIARAILHENPYLVNSLAKMREKTLGNDRSAAVGAGDIALIVGEIAEALQAEYGYRLDNGDRVRADIIPDQHRDRLEKIVEVSREMGIDDRHAAHALDKYDENTETIAEICRGFWFSPERGNAPGKKLELLSDDETKEVADLAGAGDPLELIDSIADAKELEDVLKCLGRMENTFHLSIPRQSEFVPVSGFKLDNELADVYPEEFGLDDDVFDFYFLENSLASVESGKAPVGTGGDFVACIDVSGSTCDEFSGSKFCILTFEKAIVLSIAEQLKKQRRRCFAFGFDHKKDFYHSHEIGKDPKAFGGFISQYPTGGTSFSFPLENAIEIIRQNRSFRRADILFITDGDSSVTESWLNNFLATKEELQIVVHTIVVGITERQASIQEKYRDKNKPSYFQFSDSVTFLADWDSTAKLGDVFEEIRS